MALLKVKPWGDDQGDHVLIEEEDFVEGQHELIDAQDKPKKAKKPKADEAETGADGDDQGDHEKTE